MRARVIEFLRRRVGQAARWIGRAERIALGVSLLAATASLALVMWLNGLILWPQQELAKTHFSLVCDTALSWTTLRRHEQPPTKTPSHLIRVVMRPFDESGSNSPIRPFKYLVKYYGDFTEVDPKTCASVKIRLPSDLDGAKGSLTQRQTGEVTDAHLKEPSGQISLAKYAIIDTIGHTNDPKHLVQEISFYESRIGMSVFLGAPSGRDPNEKIVDISIKVPKRFTVASVFPNGYVVNTDSHGVLYKWIVSGNSTVFGDFWIDIQDARRRRLVDVFNFAAGALLGAAVSAMYGALLSLVTRRPVV